MLKINMALSFASLSTSGAQPGFF